MPPNTPSSFLVAIRSRLIWLLVIGTGAILLPSLTLLWFQQKRESHHELGEWHDRMQAATHDAILSIDELLLANLLEDSAPSAPPDELLQRDRSLYGRILFYLDRIPKGIPDVDLPDDLELRQRLEGISDQIRTLKALDTLVPRGRKLDLMVAARDTLRRLRLLHWGAHERLSIQHEQTRQLELKTFVPATAVLMLAGLLVCGGILRNIRSQLVREERLIGSLTVSEARYRNLVGQLPHGVVEFDRNGTITYNNPTHDRILGCQPGELEGRPIWEFLADEAARESLQADLQKLIAGETPPPAQFERPHRETGEETTLRVDWGHRRNDDGKSTGFLAILTDVTEQTTAQKALEESEEKFRTLIEGSQDWIWEMNLQGQHTFSNKNCHRILGYSEPELAAINLHELFHPDTIEEVEERLPKIIAAKSGWSSWVVRMRHKQGGYRYLESNATPIRDREGRLVGFRGIDRDITDRIRLENDLRDSLRETETLLKEIHHRVKNNLQMISSLLHFQQKKAVGVQERELLVEAQTRLKAMTLVHEHLYRARSLSQIHMPEYLRDLTDQIQVYEIPRGTIDLTIDIEPIQLPVEQALPVGMIVTELMTNALKHAFPNPGSGSIAIALRADEDKVRVTVSDNGIGLPSEADSDPSTASFGLNLVENLARQLGGVLDFEQAEGTSVSLEFPTHVSEGPTPQPNPTLVSQG